MSEVDTLPHDEVFGHLKGNIGLELVIPDQEDDLSSQHAALRVDLVYRQLEAVEHVLGVGCGRSGVGVDDAHFDDSFCGSRQGMPQ